jgi:hypothetical protein
VYFGLLLWSGRILRIFGPFTVRRGTSLQLGAPK